MRLIDADALKVKISYRQWDVDDDLPRDEASTRISECYVIDRMVDDMPTVDAVEVIRCKDCKYYREDGDCWHEWDNDGRIYYQSVINEPSPDDYCSRAERKEE